MTTSDGHVVGVTKVVDHGPDTARWNLVIVGDGYRETELTAYHTHVLNFINTLRATPPFDEMFCGINVHRIDVVSNQSGADDPGCAGGTATTANTYFDATFCTVFAGSPLDRLLGIDSGLALSVATTHVPLRHQVLCIVNSTKYGGSGGNVATCSVHTSASEIAIHELGHSAFGLADEYGGDGTGTPAGEPLKPNVTRDTNRATNKWRALIDAATPMPSGCDGTCTASTCTPPATPPPPNAVGTYEGAIYSNCNTYRPRPSCYMRDYGPFCPVCAGVIRAVLTPFQPAESITLVTPSITFLNVPSGMGGVGVTTHRAIRWDVVTCRSLTFRIISGPTGGFGTPSGTLATVTADPIVPAGAARIWLSYTSTNPGDSASGTVRVRCDQTGETWDININANTIARPRTAVSFVLDRSGSMNDDPGDGTTKVAKLREAMGTFIQAMLPDDGVGLVRFNQAAQRIMEVEDAGPAPGGSGRTSALGHVNGSEIDPDGTTSIGDGVVKGRNMLNDAQAAPTPDYGNTALVVLTDGMWNMPPSLAAVSGSIGATTYGIGFGMPSNISVPALTALCQGHSGYLLVTGAITPDQSMRLSKYFLQILAGVTNAQIAADPGGVLYGNAEHRIPLWICEADFGMDVFLLSPMPYAIDFQLEAPDGTRITPVVGSTNAEYVSAGKISYYRCALPVLPADPTGSHEGLWHAVLKLSSKYQGRYRQALYSASASGVKALPYELVAHTYSSLVFAAQVAQTSFDLGASAHLWATLTEYERPLSSAARVWVEVTTPSGGSVDILPLPLDASGRYATSYAMPLPGVYFFRIRARGETMHGFPFEREKTLTAVAVPAGDHWSPGGPKHNPWCEIIDCIKRAQAKDGRINLGTLLKCLDVDCCKSHQNEGRAVAHSLASLDASALNADALRDTLLAALARKSEPKE